MFIRTDTAVLQAEEYRQTDHCDGEALFHFSKGNLDFRTSWCFLRPGQVLSPPSVCGRRPHRRNRALRGNSSLFFKGLAPCLKGHLLVDTYELLNRTFQHAALPVA